MAAERLTLLGALFLAPLSYVLISLRVMPSAMLLWQLLLVVAVIVVIAFGADWLVDASCRIAAALGVSNLVIGLTVVALGTSAPEIAASLLAGFEGHPEITVANAIGSNIFNTCFVLGGVAVLLRNGLKVDRFLVVRDTPALLGATLLLMLFVGAWPSSDVAAGLPAESSTLWPQLLNLRLELGEGVLLLGILVLYLYGLYLSRGGDAAALEEERRQSIEHFGHASARDVPLLLAGLAAVVGGCHVLVGHADVVDGTLRGHGALWFAQIWGLPDYIVGATIIAAGTSAPELVVSLVAAARGAHGLSAGNLIGSNIFNTLGVVGIAGILLQPPLAAPVVLTPAVVPSIGAFAVIVLLTILFMARGNRISRLEGVLLLALGLARWALDFAFHGAV